MLYQLVAESGCVQMNTVIPLQLEVYRDCVPVNATATCIIDGDVVAVASSSIPLSDEESQAARLLALAEVERYQARKEDHERRAAFLLRIARNNPSL